MKKVFKILNLNFKVLLILLLINLIGCKEKKLLLNCQDIKMIKIGYLPENINTFEPVNSPEKIASYDQTKYELIIDSIFICDLTSYINKLKSSNIKSSHDFRIICYLYLKNNTTPYKLYIGDNNDIMYNEKQMKYNEELVIFFKNSLNN